jgi:hypothetical protein
MPSLVNGTYTGTIPFGTIDQASVAISITSTNYLNGILPVPPLPSGATKIYLIVSVKNTSATTFNFTGLTSQMTFQIPNLPNGTVVKGHVYEDPVNQGYVDIGTFPTTFTSNNGSVTIPTPFKMNTCTTNCGNGNPGPSPFPPGGSVMVMITD